MHVVRNRATPIRRIYMNTSMNNLRNETIQGPFELVNGRLGYAGRGIVPGSTYLELMGVDQKRSYYA